jgi:D-alanyl-D-alanine carboxypeptidase
MRFKFIPPRGWRQTGLCFAIALLLGGTDHGWAAPKKGRAPQRPAAPVTAADLDVLVKAKAVLLVDAATGSVLFSRDPDVPYPPASTTKLMTSLLLYERTGLQGSVRVAKADTLVEPSHVPLVEGEVVPVRALTASLLIGSDNDSAMALGRHCGGTLDRFVAMMNQRATELGCQRTQFRNPNGLPAPGQFTTCNDLMKIFRKVLSVPELREMAQTRVYRLITARGAQEVRNHNRLLFTYPGMGPAKTGWTYSSKHTYAAAATRGGHELLLTLLNSTDKWRDATLLFNYGFNVLSGTAPQVEAQPASASVIRPPQRQPSTAVKTPVAATVPAPAKTVPPPFRPEATSGKANPAPARLLDEVQPPDPATVR